MSRIEKGLHEVHASYASNKVAGNLPVSISSYGQSVNGDNPQNLNDIEPIFARISEVFSGAPAEMAGLKVDDKITRFGNINWMNHERLSKVAETVQRNEGVSLMSQMVLFFFNSLKSNSKLSLSKCSGQYLVNRGWSLCSLN